MNYLGVAALAVIGVLITVWYFLYGTKADKAWFGNTAVSTLVTGLPGNGKTLFVVSELFKMAKVMAAHNAANPATYSGPTRLSSDHVIYTHGIKELAIEGCASLINPREWHMLPAGSVVVIDECQKTFIKRANGAAVPPYVAAFETLRHDGHRAILLTQHPQLLDAHVRHLIGQHLHFERLFGMNLATVFEWMKVKEPDNKTHRKEAQKTQWQYPTWAYSLYKSAEVHTIKRQIPKVVKLALGAFVVCGLALALGYKFIMSNTSPLGTPPQEQAQAATATPAASQGGMASSGPPDYFDARISRISGLPHTAPVYDAITAPTVAPKPVACAAMGDTCRCYTQQGTRMPAMSENMCRRIVEEGYFDDSPAPVEYSEARSEIPHYQPQGEGRAPVTLSDVTAAMPAKLDPNQVAGK